MKKCSKCGVAKDVAEFGKHARQTDGLQRNCKQCQREYFSAYRKNKPEIVKGTARRWLENNRDKSIRRNREFRAANPERSAQYSATYRANNPEKRRESAANYRKRNEQRERIYRKLYAANNRDKLAAKASMRRALKLMATPEWANKAAIFEIYEFCARVSNSMNVEHHVDHIVPLVSDLVCGLHCESNLRVIPATINLSKSNRYWPDMPD